MSRYRQWTVDIGVAVAVTALLVASIETSPETSPRGLSVTGYTLVLTASLSLAVRRHFPVVVLLLCGVCTLNVYILDRPDLTIEAPLLCALTPLCGTGAGSSGSGPAWSTW